MCRGRNRSMDRDHTAGVDARSKLDGIGGKHLARWVLCSPFENVKPDVIKENTNGYGNVDVHSDEDGVGNGHVVTNGTDGDDSDGNKEEESSRKSAGDGINGSKGDLGREDSWIMLKVYNYQPIEELIDSTMEFLSFCLVEPVSLG